MKPAVRRPVRSRSQVRLGHRPRYSMRVHAESPAIKRLKRSWRLPDMDVPHALNVVAVVFLAIALLVLYTAPEYRIKTIEVRGNQGTATQDIEAAASFVRERNVFLVRSGDVASAVENLSGVERADVRVVLPDRLEIRVRDTRPEVAWVSGNLISWVDKNGVVRDQPATDPEKRITIYDSTGRTYQAGDKVDTFVLAAAQQLSVQMPRELQGLEFSREGELMFVSNQGWRALFDARGDLAPQIAALQRVRASGRGCTYLDVRVPHLVACR